MAELLRLNTLSQITDVDDRKTMDVPVQAWGVTVRLREMSADEAIAFTQSLEGPSKKNAMVKIVALCAVNDNNERVFTDADLEKLKKKGLTTLIMLQRKAMELNGLKEPEAELEDAKNG